jgi:hypothetical protein
LSHDAITYPTTARIALELNNEAARAAEENLFIRRIAELGLKQEGTVLDSSGIENAIQFCLNAGYFERFADHLSSTRRLDSEAKYLRKIASHP